MGSFFRFCCAPTPRGHGSDDRLTAGVDVDVLDGYLLLSLAAVALQSLYLGDKGAKQLLSELLSLPSSAADLNLSPQRKREKLFEALLGQLEAEARHRPVLMERAVDQWLKAGQHAAARLAHLEAIRHFDRGLAALEALPKGAARDAREIELQLARGLPLFTAEGFRSAGAAQAYTRAHELAEGRDDARQLFMAVYGLWQSANGSGIVPDCRRLSTSGKSLRYWTSSHFIGR